MPAVLGGEASPCHAAAQQIHCVTRGALRRSRLGACREGKPKPLRSSHERIGRTLGASGSKGADHEVGVDALYVAVAVLPRHHDGVDAGEAAERSIEEQAPVARLVELRHGLGSSYDAQTAGVRWFGHRWWGEQRGAGAAAARTARLTMPAPPAARRHSPAARGPARSAGSCRRRRTAQGARSATPQSACRSVRAPPPPRSAARIHHERSTRPL